MSARGELGLATLFGADAHRFDGPRAPREEIVVHRDPSRLAELRTHPALSSGLALLDAWDGTRGFATVFSPSGPGQLKLMLRPKPSEVRPLYEGGLTIAFHRVEEMIPTLAGACRRLERDLDLPVGAMYVEAFCSKAGGGAAPHFDRTTTFNIQLEGTKTWWFAENPSVEFPPDGCRLGARPSPMLASACSEPLPSALPTDARTAVVGPGSVVFVPAGLLHATRTETPSFALLFTVARSLTADRIARDVERRLRAFEALRASLMRQRGSSRRAAKCAARELRRLADALERAPERIEERDRRRLRLRRDLGINVMPSGSVVVRDGAEEHVVSPRPEVVRLLSWMLERRASFDLRDVAVELSAISVAAIRSAVRALVRSGLLEETTDYSIGHTRRTRSGEVSLVRDDDAGHPHCSAHQAAR